MDSSGLPPEVTTLDVFDKAKFPAQSRTIQRLVQSLTSDAVHVPGSDFAPLVIKPSQ